MKVNIYINVTVFKDDANELFSELSGYLNVKCSYLEEYKETTHKIAVVNKGDIANVSIIGSSELRGTKTISDVRRLMANDLKDIIHELKYVQNSYFVYLEKSGEALVA